MNSAFGVDHGEISKAYSKVSGRMASAQVRDSKTLRSPEAGGQTMNNKLRVHALEARQLAAKPGRRALKSENLKQAMTSPFSLKRAREQKKGAQGIYDAIGRNNRKRKTLP